MANQTSDRLRDNIRTVFLGHSRAVDLLLIGMLARGHVLIEDVPGVGKTVLAKSLAKSIDCKFSRIQLTPDLLPSDVLGVSIFNSQTQKFELLEAMSEEQVSVENMTLPLERPFMVVATQNPFEFEGTYYLPENQLDRFILRIAVGYPERSSEHRILTTQPSRTALDQLKPVMTGKEVVELQDIVPTVKLDPSIVDYVLDLVEATRHDEQLHLGVSPRGALALTQAVQASAVLNGRDFATPDDVKSLFIPVCAHRVVSKTYLHNGDANATARVLQTIMDQVPAPR